jgi:DNA/RNA endonuclease YhcR with UshA esterase domain
MRSGLLKRFSWIALAAIIVLSNAIGLIPGRVWAASADSSTTAPAPATDVVPSLPNGTGKKVLFDNTHGQTAGAADWVIDGAFSDFADGLRADGFTVDSLNRPIPFTFGEQAVTYDTLKNYDVFIIGEANIPYKKPEQDAMLQYVQNGGSIFFIADHYNSDRNKNRWDASEVFNGYRRGAWTNPAQGMTPEEAASPAMQGVQSSDWLAQNFGVRFRYNALGDVDNVTDVVSPDQAFGITAGVSSVAMHAGSTLAILDPTKSKGLVYVPTDVPAWANAVDSGIYDGGGRAEGPFAAVSKVGAGKAAFIGDSSPVEDATPKYLREDNGTKKTTYDGFKGEANDATFLVHTVDWLANHESYTSLAQVAGLQLDQPTQLLAFENPAQSTEPQPEPWAAPDPGYKWYDPTTFKPGSYGSTQQSVQPKYSFVHQSTLPNAQTFQIRVAADNLLPEQTVSGLTVGLYLTGGKQIAKIQNADGTWPASYGYSSAFSVTADATGHAYKDLTVQVDPTASGQANLRLKANGSNQITEAVSVANVPAEPLPNDHPPVPATISIADARHTADNTLVTVEGVITSEPGVFGGQGFYLQDDTAGIYVYQTTAGFHAGDKISISAKKTTYSTEVELSNPVALDKIGTANVPQAIVQPALNDDNQGQRVKLENVTIQNYKKASPAGSFEFDAVSDSTSTHVRVDVRTGIGYADFQTKFPAGSLVHIAGISSIFNGMYQLKPLTMSDVELADATPPTTTLLADGVTGEGSYNTKDVAVTLTAQDNAGGSGVASTQYRLNGGAWTAVQGPVTVSAEGKNLVEFFSTDNAGNVEAEQGVQIWIDKTAPAMSYEGSTSFYQTDSAVNLVVTATDSFSGVQSVVYALDGAAIASVESISPLVLSAGSHTLTVTAEDNAGNQAAVSITLTSLVDIDHFAALIDLGESKGWFSNHGTAQSLRAKVNAMQKAKQDSNTAKKLDDLKNEIAKESGKHIDASFADLLLKDLAYMQSTGV